MKTYTNVYKELCSQKNIVEAYRKARKNKSRKQSVLAFEEQLEYNLETLRNELLTLTYKPFLLKRFIVRDPKTRVIHAFAFRDRIVHHAVINMLEPIFEKIFIYDSFASRKGKGTHPAIRRFNYFKRKVSVNGLTVQRGGGGRRTKIMYKVIVSNQIYENILIMLIMRY